MGITYKSAGVDIAAGDETIRRIKPLVRSTFNDKVLADIGLFGGFYDAKFEDHKHPILCASSDGVGTKLMIAFLTDTHNTVGQCLVNHCTNDILCCGAKPLFFLDYFGTGKLDPGVAEQIIRGFVDGCINNSCALIGGETAEMPQMYKDGEYDISGTIVGVVEKDLIVNGKNIKEGDVMIGLESTGLHTNGFSLARAALLEKYKVDQHLDVLGKTVGEALLEVHKSYLETVYPLVEVKLLNGISHITGGGIYDNTERIIPEGLKMNVNWGSWKVLPIFDLIQEAGDVAEEEMRQVFNMGVGMILVVDKSNVDEVMEKCKKDNPTIIGEIIKG
jgi:phosphoribosylformylglycinamidine cyclo-ligase